MAETKSTTTAAVDKEADAKLEHSVEGVTTRDDALDAGAPMLPGDPSEPQGPEDAFGPGPKRGDYRERQADGAVHYEAVVVPDAKPDEPATRLVAQNPRVEEIGEVAGAKGGVTTG